MTTQDLLSLARYATWKSSEEMASDIFGDAHPVYLTEKAQTIQTRGILYLVGCIDEPHRQRLLDAVQRYADGS